MHFDAVQHTNPASPDSDRDSSVCIAWSVACYCDKELTELLSWI